MLRYGQSQGELDRETARYFIEGPRMQERFAHIAKGKGRERTQALSRFVDAMGGGSEN